VARQVKVPIVMPGLTPNVPDIPVGTIVAWSGTQSAPEGWLPCDGRIIDGTLHGYTFAALPALPGYLIRWPSNSVHEVTSSGREDIPADLLRRLERRRRAERSSLKRMLTQMYKEARRG